MKAKTLTNLFEENWGTHVYMDNDPQDAIITARIPAAQLRALVGSGARNAEWIDVLENLMQEMNAAVAEQFGNTGEDRYSMTFHNTDGTIFREDPTTGDMILCLKKG